MTKNDQYYIKCCIALGEQAASRGNTAVGSLIVKDEEIICEAEESTKTKNDITCHAEMEAIRLSVKKLGTDNLNGCILYSTHEPCIMCSYAIRFYRISKVVFLHKVNYLGGVSSSMPLLASTEVPPHWADAPATYQIKITVENEEF